MTGAAQPSPTLLRALLSLLAETDSLSPKAMTARELCAKLDSADSESIVERTLREMNRDGLVDAFHEPYIAPRYLISRQGREALNP